VAIREHGMDTTDPRSHSGKTCTSAPLANPRLKAGNLLKTIPMPLIAAQYAPCETMILSPPSTRTPTVNGGGKMCHMAA
jgi:hypothetical protein